MMKKRLVIVSAGVLGMGGSALGQFSPPAATQVREKITGLFIPGDSGIAVEQGDQIGAFDKEGVIGLFQYDTSDPAFSVTVFGDDPNTEEKEGPQVGDKVTFRFYDASTNTELDLLVLNEQGESVNLKFQGDVLPDLPIELPGFDLTPTRSFDVTPGSEGGGGEGGGGGGGESGLSPDVNGDGVVDTEDAALVLRQVMRGGQTTEGAATDVNGDGVTNTLDAIEVLRNRD